MRLIDRAVESGQRAHRREASSMALEFASAHPDRIRWWRIVPWTRSPSGGSSKRDQRRSVGYIRFDLITGEACAA
jgi:hypothetical protein